MPRVEGNVDCWVVGLFGWQPLRTKEREEKGGQPVNIYLEKSP